MVLVNCTFSLFLYYFMKFQQDLSIVLELFPGQENLIKGNNSKSKQGRIMVLVYCTLSQDSLSLFEVSTKPLNYFCSFAPDEKI